MQSHWAQVKSGAAGSIVMALQHPTIVTLGIRGDPALDLPMGSPHPWVRVDRGGQATLHSPGQLVLYPVISLRQINLGVRRYVSLLHSTTIDLCATRGVSTQVVDPAGLETVSGREKIASVGVRIREGVSLHGVALNVHNDLELFQSIRLCGGGSLGRGGVTSLARELGPVPQPNAGWDLAGLGAQWFELFRSGVESSLTIDCSSGGSSVKPEVAKGSLGAVGSAFP